MLPAARNLPLDAIVLDGDQRQALVCLRSLARAGLRVGACASSRWAPTPRSRRCALGRTIADASAGSDALVEDLLGVVRDHRPRVVIPCTDGTVEALRARRADLERHAQLALAAESGLAVAVDKAKTFGLARSVGVDLPRTVEVDRLTAIDAGLEAVGVPAVVKPIRSWIGDGNRGRRVVSSVVLDRDEAWAASSPILAEGGSVVLQEWVPGRREAVSLFTADGRVWARFAQVAHRMFPPLGGSSVVRESIPLPADLTPLAEALVAEAGLDGYAEVEFRRHADGRPALMEINPRLSASVEIAVRSGVDFPAFVFAHAAGERLVAASEPRPGVRMRWLGGDIRWLRATLSQGGRPDAPPAGRALAAFGAEFFRPAHYDYFELDDPLPALAATAGFAATAVRRLPVRAPVQVGHAR